MPSQPRKDIFISYRNDGSGNQFATRLCQDLEENGYSVYFNPKEERGAVFPQRLKAAIRDCKDFVLVLSKGCLAQLCRNEPVDWVREEILTARSLDRHIIPILLEDAEMPKNSDELPEELRFLTYIDALRFPEQYMISPFSELQRAVIARQDGRDLFKDAFNSNPVYSVSEDYATVLRRAEEGDIGAMYEAGMMAFYGAASDRAEVSAWDFERAAFWLRKVSASDSDLRFHADSILGRMYYQGLVPREPQSYEKAYRYHCAASEGDDFSARERAFLMRIGAGCPFDFDAILDYYRQTADKGDDESRRALAAFLTAYGRFEEALDVYCSMDCLSPESEYQLGLLYLRGVTSDPPRPDTIQAAYHFRIAADSNHLQAAYEYGTMCLRPTGRFRKNFREAEKYFRIAADGGHATAQYMLGYMYRTGLVERNLPEAVRYLEMAREQNHSQASLELASIYQQPECRNYGRAFACASLAASHGMAEGELILGNLLFWGRGCEADMDKAYEMYRRAYDHGMYYAAVMMEKIRELENLGGEA